MSDHSNTDTVLDLIPLPESDQVSKALEVRTGDVRRLLDEMRELIDSPDERRDELLLAVTNHVQRQVEALETDIDNAFVLINAQQIAVSVLRDQRDEAFSTGYTAGYNAMQGDEDVYSADDVSMMQGDAEEEAYSEGYDSGFDAAKDQLQEELNHLRDTISTAQQTFQQTQADLNTLWGLLSPEEQQVILARRDANAE